MDREEARVRMLRLWLALSKSDAAPSSISICTTQSTLVHADTLVANAEQTLFACSNLATPLGTYRHAVLRDRDVAQLERPLSVAQVRALLN